jgi:cysteine desulfurase/selenocysteine lyase|tara:strand:+ start:36526 stop:37755 length:1230 start_codon:yes stop_codon:yes gene_type:complete
MQTTKTIFDAKTIRKDFPILQRKVHGKPLVYLDNAATSQKPRQVIEAIDNYYKNSNANIHRSIHTLGEESTEQYEKSHEKVAGFINADSYQNIVFTKNTTESLNLLAYSLTANLKKGDEIVISEMEHHSNLVPWQQLAKQRGLKLNFIEIDKEGNLSEESINKNINKKTKIVSLTHISNVLGTINPIKEIAKIAHENGAFMVVDGAQSAPHMPVDVKDLDADFYAFSGHKMLGPTGIGVLYGKKELLEVMQPFLYGGGMIREVKFDNTTFNELPWKFEAGTMNIVGGIGLGVAIDYLKKVGMKQIQNRDKELVDYAIEKLKDDKDITLYGPKERSAVVSFNVKGVHAHDVSQILDSEGVAIRAGHHCCMPLMKVMKIQATARASFYLYNTEEEVDVFIKALEKVKKMFS